MNNKNSIKSNLEEKFRQMLARESAPDGLKSEVFSTLDTLNLIGDITDLFTTRFIQTEAIFLGIEDEEEENGAAEIQPGNDSDNPKSEED